MSSKSSDELRKYADELPEIYKEILGAFPRIEPHRRAGYGLAFQSLAADFDERHKEFSLGEIVEASEQLQQHGLVEIKHGVFIHPTELGERLISIIAGAPPPRICVPPLPPPPAVPASQ